MANLNDLRELTAYRGHIISPVHEQELRDYRDGVLIVDDRGRIVFCGEWSEVENNKGSYKNIHSYGDKIILPGLIDMHLHLPQVTVTGKSGEHLMTWLKRFIFPSEGRCADPQYALGIANWFFDELVRNGTTLGVVFSTIHKEATDIAFQVASERGCRAIMGKVLMNANAPDYLTEDINASLSASEELCEKWHGHDDGRLLYAFTPRFAVTSTSELLTESGKLWRAKPGTYLHTHLAESLEEVEFVKELFPKSRSYVDVYHDHGLLGHNNIMAHSIHLSDSDLDVLKETDSSLAHCPSSNFFLKSGVFGYRRVEKKGVRFGIGSDVAAGPQMSLFCVMKDANYMQPDEWLNPVELLYRATLGGARALDLDERIGSLDEGKDADFVVVDPTHRTGIIDDILTKPTDEILSSLVFLGDDRVVEATFVRGKEIFNYERAKELSQSRR
jgi:guanine deaminase